MPWFYNDNTHRLKDSFAGKSVQRQVSNGWKEQPRPGARQQRAKKSAADGTGHVTLVDEAIRYWNNIFKEGPEYRTPSQLTVSIFLERIQTIQPPTSYVCGSFRSRLRYVAPQLRKKKRPGRLTREMISEPEGLRTN